MSDSDIPGASLWDNDRFDPLFDSAEEILSAFILESLDGHGDEISEEELAQEVDANFGSVMCVLAMMSAEIKATSKGVNGEDIFDLKLTIPTGDLRAAVRKLMDYLDVDRDD
jgi:hypothetical protein